MPTPSRNNRELSIERPAEVAFDLPQGVEPASRRRTAFSGTRHEVKETLAWDRGRAKKRSDSDARGSVMVTRSVAMARL